MRLSHFNFAACNHEVIDVTILDALKEAEDGAYSRHAPRLTLKVLHHDTFEKVDTKKAEAVCLIIEPDPRQITNVFFFSFFSIEQLPCYKCLFTFQTIIH